MYQEISKEDIVSLAIEIKEKYKTNDPFKIAEIENISVEYLKSHIPAYTIKPLDEMPPAIIINSKFDLRSRKILCAHELGHALLHQEGFNNFDGNCILRKEELEANLFAVALLFDYNAFNMRIENMDNYMLKGILDHNITWN